jgi:hypothetical protein
MAFKMKGNPMQRNYGIGNPLPQKKDNNEGTVELRDDDQGTYRNEKNQTQEYIYNKRVDAVDAADKKRKEYQTNLDKFEKQEGGLTKEQIQASNLKKKTYNDLYNAAWDNYTHSTDSITNVNTTIDYNKKKRADESGLFHRVGDPRHDAAHDGNHPTANTFIDDDHNTQEQVDAKKKRDAEKSKDGSSNKMKGKKKIATSPYHQGYLKKKEKGSKMPGDLDKDGKMSRYESKRQKAIEKNMKK